MDIYHLKNQLDDFFGVHDYPDDGWDFNAISLSFMESSFLSNKLGLMIKNSDHIDSVYTAVFPDEKVLDKILSEKKPNSLLFTHHPKIWDSSMETSPFREIDEWYLQKLKDNKISIYALHTPLDMNGEYSTSYNLAKALDFEILSDFYLSQGIYKGVLCKSHLKSFEELENHIRGKFQHPIGSSTNGDSEIMDGKICIVSGGGMIPKVIDEMHESGINTYITGAILTNKAFRNSQEFCRRIKREKINVIMGSHHTTEKYACIRMVEFFGRMGLQSQFIEGVINPSDWMNTL